MFFISLAMIENISDFEERQCAFIKVDIQKFPLKFQAECEWPRLFTFLTNVLSD